MSEVISESSVLFHLSSFSEPQINVVYDTKHDFAAISNFSINTSNLEETLSKRESTAAAQGERLRFTIAFWLEQFQLVIC